MQLRLSSRHAFVLKWVSRGTRNNERRYTYLVQWREGLEVKAFLSHFFVTSLSANAVSLDVKAKGARACITLAEKALESYRYRDRQSIFEPDSAFDYIEAPIGYFRGVISCPTLA